MLYEVISLVVRVTLVGLMLWPVIWFVGNILKTASEANRIPDLEAKLTLKLSGIATEDLLKEMKKRDMLP